MTALPLVAGAGDFDTFLLAGRNTLFEQEALGSFLHLCQKRGVGIVVGGPCNSGILAPGPKAGANWNYAPAPDWVLTKAGRLLQVCTAHGVRLVDAAFLFPLRHPSVVVSVVPDGQGLGEIESYLLAATARIPQALR